MRAVVLPRVRRAGGARGRRVARPDARPRLGRRRAARGGAELARRDRAPRRPPGRAAADPRRRWRRGAPRHRRGRHRSLPSLAWGDDERYPAPDFEILGDHTDGTYAELVAVPEENVLPAPAGLGLARGGSAAARRRDRVPRAVHPRRPAVRRDRRRPRRGQRRRPRIAIALAHLAGARVLVTSSSPEKLERAVELGAAGGVLYTDDGLARAARELAGDPGRRPRVGSTGLAATRCRSSSRGGRLVAFGATGGDQATVQRAAVLLRPVLAARHDDGQPARLRRAARHARAPDGGRPSTACCRSTTPPPRMRGWSGAITSASSSCVAVALAQLVLEHLAADGLRQLVDPR